MQEGDLVDKRERERLEESPEMRQRFPDARERKREARRIQRQKERRRERTSDVYAAD